MTSRQEPESDRAQKLQIAVLVSGHGRGSNMAAVIEGCKSGEINGNVAVVIGTRSGAPALERAREEGVETAVISPKRYVDDDAGYAAALFRELNCRNVGLICLAGYMRCLPAEVVHAFDGRIVNVHPALLPLFGGRGMFGEHVHTAVIESGMKVSGCTVHFVDEEYDSGPIILQTSVPVLDDDTPQTLASRVLQAEHLTYVRAVALIAAGKVRREGRRVLQTP